MSSMGIGDKFYLLLEALWQVYIASYISMFVHEAGHLLGAYIVGYRPTELRIGNQPRIAISFRNLKVLLGLIPISGRAEIAHTILRPLKFEAQGERVIIRSVPWTEHDYFLKPNDTILTIDGASVSSESDFTTLLNAATGRFARITFLRSGAEQTVEWRIPTMKADLSNPHDRTSMPQITRFDKFRIWFGKNERLPIAMYGLAGPFTSLLLSAVFYYSTVRFHPHAFTLFSTILNFQIFITTLLPWVPGSDGNETLREITGRDWSTSQPLRGIAIAFTNFGFLLGPVLWLFCWKSSYHS